MSNYIFFLFWYWLYVYKIYGNKGQTKATLLVLRCTFVTSTYFKQNNLPQINDRHIEHIEQKSVLILMIKTYGMYLWRNWNSLLLMDLFIKQINIILFKHFVLMWNLPILIFYNQICIFNLKKTTLTILKFSMWKCIHPYLDVSCLICVKTYRIL